MCSDVLMGNTKHVSFRIDSEILERVDAEAKRMRWSRSVALHTCVEFGLMDLEQERGPGGKLNDEKGISAPDNGGAAGRVESGNKGGNKAGAGIARLSRRSLSSSGVESKITVGQENKTGEAIAPFRGSGKCPHGYMNWMVCPDCNPKVAK